MLPWHKWCACLCGCVFVCVYTSVSIQSVPPFAFEGVVSCLTDLLLPPVLTLPEAPIIGPESCQSEPIPTHLVVIQPDSGLPWTAQPAHFSYASSLEPHCVSGLPHHTTAKRLRAERTHVISLTVQSAGQTFAPPPAPHPPFRLSVRCVAFASGRHWSSNTRGTRREICSLTSLSAFACLRVWACV